MQRIKKVMLVTPPYHCGMVESAGVWMPLGLAYLAGSLRRAGFEVEIYDAMSLFQDADQIQAHISDVRPDAVGITAYTATVKAAIEVLKSAKEAMPKVITIIGGVHPTHMATEVLANSAIDYVVRGEGEETLPELLACLNAGDHPEKVAGLSFVDRSNEGIVVNTPCRPLIQDLDSLRIAWDLIDWPTYHYRTKPGSRLAIASWARGCTEACTFCSQHKMWRRTWRARNPEAIIAEMRMLKERYGIDTLEVADEYPTLDRQRWEYILDRLIEENLGIELLVETRADDIIRDADILDKYRAAGILHMYVGVESVRQDRLDLMRKNLRVEESRRAIELLNEVGIITETSFLLGFPDDTPETVRQTLKLSFEYAPDLAFFLAVTPWPYSDLCPQVADKVEVLDYSQYNLINPIIKPDAMSRQELAGMLSNAFMRFYMDKMKNLHLLPPHKRDYMMRVA
ncbi:MAG TPA: cobalamin-dependent protein, partial [Anaerolineae bacterium]|nr:cobalamin-dependent protein [Anaerolineae bacterium]